MGREKFSGFGTESQEKQGEFDFEEVKSVCDEMNQAIKDKRMHPSQPIWWGNRIKLAGADAAAKITKKWNDQDRANCLAKIGQEMVSSGQSSGKASVKELAEWLERIAFVLDKPADFLENNRKNIIG